MESRNLIEATCPECRGPLTEVDNAGVVEYQCLVGHRYSPLGILQAHYETQERTLWAAVVSLEEAAKLVEAVEPQVPPGLIAEITQRTEEKQRQAQSIRQVLDQLKPYYAER